MIALLALVTFLAVGVFAAVATIWPSISRIQLAIVIFVVYLLTVACITAWIYHAAHAMPDGAVILEPPPKR